MKSQTWKKMTAKESVGLTAVASIVFKEELNWVFLMLFSRASIKKVVCSSFLLNSSEAKGKRNC